MGHGYGGKMGVILDDSGVRAGRTRRPRRGMLGQGGAALLPFTDNFTRADGAIGNGWNGATWTISGNKAINTPSLGSELVTNGDMSSGTGWTVEADWSIASNIATKVAGAANRNLYQSILTTGSWYRTVFDLVRTAGNFNALFGTNNVSISRTTNATFTDSFRANGAQGGVRSGSTGAGTVDNVSIKLLTLNTLFATRDFGRSDVDVSVPVTLVSGNSAGLVLCLDSVSSPANFIIAYHDGVTAKLDKIVAGAYTNLISTAATYSAGASIRVTKSGNTIKLFYNSVQIGADQSVSDAGIISNTLHGMFDLYSGNSLGTFSIVAN